MLSVSAYNTGKNIMKIYVDADACPKVIKEVLYRTVNRRKIFMTLVADQFLKIPVSEYITAIQVEPGIDSADEKIVELVVPGDLVVTADVPLADKVIEKGGFALNPRGELYTELNIKERLAVRDILAEMRSCGIESGGPPPFSNKDKEKFTNQLDRFLTKFNK
jgi:uncharacterized protein YaiI (UPF0178 family)